MGTRNDTRQRAFSLRGMSRPKPFPRKALLLSSPTSSLRTHQLQVLGKKLEKLCQMHSSNCELHMDLVLVALELITPRSMGIVDVESSLISVAYLLNM